MTLPVLPACRHRGAEELPGRWRCHSPRLVLPTGLVSEETCRSRCPYVDHEGARPGAGAREPRFEWISTARLIADAVALAGRLPTDCEGVAGIPRSGMVPASVIATQLHLPLYELTECGRLNRLGHGSRGRAAGFDARASGPLAVVDDTVYSGTAMRAARAHLARLRRRAVFAAVYVRPEEAGAVDLAGRLLPSPHLLEWNFANNGPFAGLAANPVYRGGIALDLDGVVVHDAESGGPAGTPYLTPRAHPCKLIVTGRPERLRAETEALLRRVRVRWERLEMLPDRVPAGTESIAQHKARHYALSGCGFFVESCPVQAELIFRMSGRPTVCPRAGRVWAVRTLEG